MARILIEIEGGLIQGIFCDEDFSVMVLDYDTPEMDRSEVVLDKEGNECVPTYWGCSVANHRATKNWELLEREEEP